MKWIFVVVLLIISISVGSGAEFTDTFQHQTAITDNWQTFGDPISSWSYTSGGSTYNIEASVTCGQYGASTRGIRMKYPSQSTYWSFFLHQVRTGAGAQTGYIKACFWDSTNTSYVEFTVDGPFQTNTAWWTRNYHLEFQYESGSIYWKINGVSQGVGCACSFTPTYIGVGGSKGAATGGVYFRFDNVHNQKGIVGICDESNNLNHTITELANDELSNTWGINTIPIAEYNTSQFDMEVKRATWAEIYNTTRIKDVGNTTILPYSSFAYSWDDIFRTDHYGLYWFNLYETLSGDPELIGQDFLYFKDVGEPSTINIEETEYAIGETLNISYYIDSPDFGANQYKIQIFDSTGQLKDERVLTMQAATEQITSTIDWEEGMLYAVLVKDTKPAITEDPPEDIIDLAYDFCTMSNVIYVTGKVYDASNTDNLVDGTLLDNVSLNWTQAGTIYNTTSDATGSYVFLDATTLLEVEWFQDVPITVHAEKTGYTHSDFDMTIIKAGRYIVDIYMVPPQRTVDLGNASVAGIVADDIFHQCIPFSSVYIWNATWNNATYTNAWGWYEFYNISNGTYSMKASKETYRDKYEYSVDVGNMSVQLDACDVADYNEATLDECDATTGWYSDNILLLDTTDYIESTGSLLANGTSTKDFNKTFSPGIDSNITGAHGYFYLYAKVDNRTNISSANVTITISSNVSGANDKIVWEQSKTNFNTTWDLHMLKISNGTETGTCNLSNITYFKFESTKSGNVITKIDFLAFVEYTGWESCVDLSIDTSDKQEGTGSLKCNGTPKSGCDLVAGRWWSAPLDASLIDKDSEIARLQFWNKESNSHTTVHYDNVYLEDADGDYLYWMPLIYSNDTWQEREFFLTDATEYGTFDISSITWLGFYNPTHYYMTSRFDDIQLVQAGQTRQNFFLSQNYNLTVYAKDMDTRYTITSFTAILDSTTVAETTTAAIVFPNVTYGIYPLEVSANGYYTNKQYVFMGQDTTQTVYLTKVENVSAVGVGQQYAPIPVEFRVIDMAGNPKRDVLVTAVGTETTMGAWSWLQDIFAYSSKVELQNTSMNGTTDSMGHLTFIMVETIKYKIDFTKPSEGINETLYFYPKEKQYTIYVTTPRSPTMINYIDWNLSVQTHNSTHSNLTLSYNDTMTQTSNLRFFVKDKNRTEIYNVTFSAQSVINVGHIVEKLSGQSYFWGFNATHDEFGEFDATKAITFKSRLIDLQLEDENYYTWISVSLLVMIATLFSAVTTKFGYVVVPFMGGFFYWIGWLGISAIIVSVVMFFGVLLYMTKKERESGL